MFYQRRQRCMSLNRRWKLLFHRHHVRREKQKMRKMRKIFSGRFVCLKKLKNDEKCKLKEVHVWGRWENCISFSRFSFSLEVFKSLSTSSHNNFINPKVEKPSESIYRKTIKQNLSEHLTTPTVRFKLISYKPFNGSMVLLTEPENRT